MDKMVQTFACIKVKISDDFLSFEKFEDVLYSLNFDATPGYPLCRQYTTNKQLFEWDGLDYNHEVARRVYGELMQWLENPVRFPFRVFVKYEPLKPDKLEQGRYRLIFGAPLYLQLLDHLLYDDMNKSEMKNLWKLPTKLGWHPFWGNAEMAMQYIQEPRSLDKSMFDWTYASWMVELETQFRHEMAVAPQSWHDLVDFSMDYAFNQTHIVLSSGDVFELQGRGLMKSGLVNTISSNSHAQCMLQNLASMQCGHEHKYITIGDDVLMEKPCDHFFEYLGQYTKIKAVEESAEFAGFDLGSKCPVYWSKHLTQLVYQDPQFLAQTLESYQQLYAFHEEKFNFITKILNEVDHTKSKTQRYIKRWATTQQSICLN